MDKIIKPTSDKDVIKQLDNTSVSKKFPDVTSFKSEMSEDEFFKLLGTDKRNALAAIVWDTLKLHGYVICKNGTLKPESIIREVECNEVFKCEEKHYTITRIKNAPDRSNLENGYNIHAIDIIE